MNEADPNSEKCINDKQKWIQNEQYKRLRFWFLITIGELLQGLWKRDFDNIPKNSSLIIKFDNIKDRYRRVRNELCHNHFQCFFDMNNTKIFDVTDKLVDEVNELSNNLMITYLTSLLVIIKN